MQVRKVVLPLSSCSCSPPEPHPKLDANLLCQSKVQGLRLWQDINYNTVVPLGPDKLTATLLYL